MKKCGGCSAVKPCSEFYKNKSRCDGYDAYCKVCRKQASSTHREKNKEHISAKQKAYREQNKERRKEYYKEYRENNKEKIKVQDAEYYQGNKEVILEQQKEYRANNKALYLHHSRKRNKLIKERTPQWADLNAIMGVYKGRPDSYHVDHEIPLQGDTVSGLHVENNLRYIPATENLSKGKHYESRIEDYVRIQR